MKEYKFSDIKILNHVFKNKTSCFLLENCVIDLREFRKHEEFFQDKNLKVYSNSKRVRKYINRNPSNNAVWYDEEFPSLTLEEELIDYSDFVFEKSFDKLFFCYDYIEWQYSHFLTDVYPKMWYYPQLKKIHKDLKFGQIRPILNFAYNLNDKTLKTKLNLLSDFAHDITDFYLKHHNFTDDFVPLEAGKTYFIEKLFIPVPFTSQDVFPWPDIQYEMYDLLKEESKKVTRTFSDRIFISRNDTVKNGWFNLRFCVNESEIYDALKPYGFENIELMDLNVFEKIKVYTTAKQLVQQVGSNCFNVVFSTPGSEFYTLIHPYYEVWCPILTSLSNRSGNKFFFIKDGIKMLGLNAYPLNYERIPDQPWYFTDMNKLAKIITKDEYRKEWDVPDTDEKKWNGLYEKKSNFSIKETFSSAWTDINDLSLDETVNLILTGRKAKEATWDDWLTRFLGDNDAKLDILDFGCSVGRNTFGLANFNPDWNVVGFDNDHMISKTGEFFNVHYSKEFKNVEFTSDWDKIKSKKFDVIVCTLVLQHIRELVLKLYIEDFKLMTKKLVVFGRRFNDFGNRSVWTILKEFGIIPCEFYESLTPVPFLSEGNPHDHHLAVYEFN